MGKFFHVPLEKDHKIADGTIFYCWAACFCESHILELYFVCTLQIFTVILLCKSIKSMGVIYNLMIENFFCKFHHWNPGIAKQLSKSSKNKSQCWSELFSVYNRFWYECKIELIGNNLLKIWILIVRDTLYKAKN